ncbi:MAG: hypothetical protein K5987_07365 [Lachnospiraceae bacterium]|nr:hypothetical protein [Lachnospiraceae bacterium]
MKLNDDDYNSTDEDLLFDDERRLKKEAGLRSMRTGGLLLSVFLLATLGVIYFTNGGFDNTSSSSKKSGTSKPSAVMQQKEAEKTAADADKMIGGSTLTASDLDFWDDFPPKEEKEKKITPEATPTPLPSDPATDGKHTLIKHDDGTEEWAEINPYLPKNKYDNSGFVYKTPLMRYYENNTKHSFNGADLSKNEEYIDFTALKNAGLDFVMLRMGQRGYASGEISLDDSFLENIKMADDAGLMCGVYFISSAINTEEAFEEAQFVLNTISSNSLNIRYPVAVSLEKEGEGKGRTDDLGKIPRTNTVLTFCRAIEDAGYYPIVYGTKETLIQKLSLGSMTGTEIWYSEDSDLPDFPYPFSMWQYDLDGNINGIAGGARLDISFEDYSMR